MDEVTSSWMRLQVPKLKYALNGFFESIGAFGCQKA